MSNENKKFSFEQIYNELQPKILQFIASRVNNREDAEDITAEVFERVYKNLPDFKWQGISVKSWVYRIAKNAVIDYYRKNNKYKDQVDIENSAVQVKSDERDVLLKILDSEEQKQLYLAISDLAEEDQYLIYYKYFEELGITEIAKRMDLSETNIGTKLHRLRKKLLSRIKPNLEDATEDKK